MKIKFFAFYLSCRHLSLSVCWHMLAPSSQWTAPWVDNNLELTFVYKLTTQPKILSHGDIGPSSWHHWTHPPSHALWFLKCTEFPSKTRPSNVLQWMNSKTSLPRRALHACPSCYTTKLFPYALRMQLSDWAHHGRWNNCILTTNNSRSTNHPHIPMQHVSLHQQNFIVHSNYWSSFNPICCNLFPNRK